MRSPRPAPHPQAAGKIYHTGLPPNYDPPSWTVGEVDVQPWHLCPGKDTNASETGNPNYCTPSDPSVLKPHPFDEELIIRSGPPLAVFLGWCVRAVGLGGSTVNSTMVVLPQC